MTKQKSRDLAPAAKELTRVVFLGGAGEIGRNMTVIEHAGKLLILDVGLMFPTEDMLGVDLVLPNFEYVRKRAASVAGIFLTHGHEDHIGGLPYLLKELKAPIYSAALTLGILKTKLDEHKLLTGARLNVVKAPGRLRLGPFKLRLFNMAHSIPDALGTLVETPAARIFYTGDFKIDLNPIGGMPTDLVGIRKACAGGIDLMMADSTNADKPGHTQSERTVGGPLAKEIAESKGRVIVACFASNIHRVQQIVEGAHRSGRKVALLGRSMLKNMDVAQELGHLKMPKGCEVPIDHIDELSPEKVVVICTGSQGEPLSALSLMASREHKWIELGKGDKVILSAIPIPGNESAVRRVIDGLFRLGVNVVTTSNAHVHVSGHASSDDLKLMLEAVKPRWFVPVHGEYRHLALHTEIAKRSGVAKSRTLVVEDGDVLDVAGGKVTRTGRIPAGYVLVDGFGIGDVGEPVLRDRRLLAEDGVVVCVVAIDSQTAEIVSGPDVLARGFVVEERANAFFEEARAEIRQSLAFLEEDEVTDWTVVRRTVRRSLGSFIAKRTGRRPIILPVVVEV